MSATTFFANALAATAALRFDREAATDRAATRSPRRPAKGSGVAVTLRGLKKSFDEEPVIHGLDLHIPAGQFVAIVGKSGCGKSTLLRLVLGLETPSAGRVALGDEAPGSSRGTHRIMFQEPRLLPWARVVDNVAVGLSDEGSRAERRARASEVLDEVGLTAKAGAWPATLSGGQRQRVALARALVSRPALLALDEPLGALDALTRIDMQAMIERIWRDQRFTAILVTHDVSEAVALADRILVIDQGGVALDVAVDSPRPRRRGDARLAALEGRILDQLLGARG